MHPQGAVSVLHSKTNIRSCMPHPKDPYGVGHAALQPPAAPPFTPPESLPCTMGVPWIPIGDPPEGTQSLTGAWLLSWPP